MWKTLLFGTTAVMVTTILTAPAAAPVPARTISPLVEETKPIYSYADAIRETVYVEAQMDSDADGRLDRIATDVMRPRETNAGLKAPIVMEASPYYGLSAAGTQLRSSPRGFPRWYDEFFVPRGYAVVEVEMQGTSRSDGCPMTGGREDTESVRAVIDWLNGRARAFTAGGSQVVASWSTGAVGMVGVSYNGTLPNAAAASGIPGLRTIVPIAAISSWYDYTHDQGVGYNGGWGNRYPQWLANYVASSTAKTECASQLDALGDNAGDGHYDITPFWTERDYRKDVSNVTASVLVVHGMEDWNVKPANFSRWWYALQARNVPRKLWLHRGAHSDPISVRRDEWQRVMHRWMDYWLFGLQSGIMAEPMVDIQRPDGSWSTYPGWPDPNARATQYHLGPAGGGAHGTLNPQPATGGSQSFTDSRTQNEAAAVADYTVSKPNRLAYVTPPLAAPVRLSGTPTASITISADTSSTPLTALLVDYGQTTSVTVAGKSPLQLMTESCTAADVARRTGCAAPPKTTVQAITAKVITKGSIDVKNRDSLTTGTPLTPGRSYRVRWETHPKDYIVPAGHRIGLVLVANLSGYLTSDPSARRVTVSLAASSLELPVVTGAAH